MLSKIKAGGRPLTLCFDQEATIKAQQEAQLHQEPLAANAREPWMEQVAESEIDSELCTAVYLDIRDSSVAASKGSSRLKIELFDCVTPKTAENFKALCLGDRKNPRDRVLSYKGSSFHCVSPGESVIGGDIKSHDGSSGESIYGPRFADENFEIGHSRAGLISMVSKGPDTNNSQFQIHLGPAPHLNGSQVVFGRVTEGLDTLAMMPQREPARATSLDPWKIVACGVLDQGALSQLKLFVPEKSVAKLIGKKGSVLIKIKEESGCKTASQPARGAVRPDGTQLFLFKGTREATQAAADAVKAIVSEARAEFVTAPIDPPSSSGLVSTPDPSSPSLGTPSWSTTSSPKGGTKGPGQTSSVPPPHPAPKGPSTPEARQHAQEIEASARKEAERIRLEAEKQMEAVKALAAAQAEAMATMQQQMASMLQQHQVELRKVEQQRRDEEDQRKQLEEERRAEEKATREAERLELVRERQAAEERFQALRNQERAWAAQAENHAPTNTPASAAQYTPHQIGASSVSRTPLGGHMHAQRSMSRTPQRAGLPQLPRGLDKISGLTPSSFRKFEPVAPSPSPASMAVVPLSTPGTPWEPLEPGFPKAPQRPMKDWDTREVAAWAMGLNFGTFRSEYARRLVDMGIEGADLIGLTALSEEEAAECLEEIGIKHPLHQRKLLRDVSTNATRAVPLIGTPR